VVTPSLVLGGVCRYATAALLIHTSIHDGILSRSHLAVKTTAGDGMLMLQAAGESVVSHASK